MSRYEFENAIHEEVRKAMLERCEQESHSYENCCSVMLQVYQRCKWCGHVDGVRPSPFGELRP